MPEKSQGNSAQKYIIRGLISIIPLWVTWAILTVLIKKITKIGEPLVRALAGIARSFFPPLADWVLQPWFQSLLAVVLVLCMLYLLGWVATQVVGYRILRTLESWIERIPLVKIVYGLVKKLVQSLQQAPARSERVALVPFPNAEMRTVGLVTRTMTDENTGRELVAVFIPTAPNPTSGYLEILPMEKITLTTWTVDEAMRFVISGGVVGPEAMSYDPPKVGA